MSSLLKAARRAGHVLVLFAGCVLASSALAAPCAGFDDVEDTNDFCSNVTWIKNRGITLGCSPGLYCPDALVTRLSMAAFLNRLGEVLVPPRIVTVGVTGGMFQNVQAAIDYAAEQGATEGDRWLVRIAPGYYHGAITTRVGVDVEGAGMSLTTIVNSGGTNPAPPTVTFQASGELRKLTIESGAAAGFKTAVLQELPVTTRLVDVGVVAHGTAPRGIQALAGTMTVERASMTIASTGGPRTAVIVEGAKFTMRDSAVLPTMFTGVSGDPVLVLKSGQANIERSDLNVVSGGSATGIRVEDGTLTLSDSTLRVESVIAVGLFNEGVVSVARTRFLVAGQIATAIDNRDSIEVRDSVLDPRGTGVSFSMQHAGTVGRLANTQMLAPTIGAPTCFQTYGAGFGPFVCM